MCRMAVLLTDVITAAVPSVDDSKQAMATRPNKPLYHMIWLAINHVAQDSAALHVEGSWAPAAKTAPQHRAAVLHIGPGPGRYMSQPTTIIFI